MSWHFQPTPQVAALDSALPGMEFKGMGQAMRIVEGFTGSVAHRSHYSRIPFYSPVAFQRFRLVFPLFRSTGVPMTDVLFTGSQAQVRYQGGVEYPYTMASTGIAPRFPVTFGGLNYGDYDESTWDTSTGVMVSDIMDFGSVIPAQTAFGIWTAFEVPATGGATPIPYSWNINNSLLQRYATTVYSGSPIIAASGAGSDVALALTSITPTASNSSVLCPIAMLIEVDEDTEMVVICGDSKGKGVNEGTTGSGIYGDVWGDEIGNKGIFERGIWENYPTYLSVNLAQGSDGNKYQYIPDAYKYRLNLMAMCNPTKVINGYAHNDQATATCPIWTVSTAFIKGNSCRVAAAGVYTCIQAGTSAGAGTGPSGTGSSIADGTCLWAWLSNDQTAEAQIMQAQYSRMIEVNRLIRANVPTAELWGFLAEPSSIYTVSTGGANPTDQTAGSGFGTLTGRRSLWNARIRANDPLLGLTGYMDTNPYLEYNYASETGKWDNQGIANRTGIDGVHENSFGYSLSAQGVLFGTVAGTFLAAGTKCYLLGDSIFDFGYHSNTVSLTFQNTAKSELHWAAMAGTLPWMHFQYDNPGTIATVVAHIGAGLGIAGETAYGVLNVSEVFPNQTEHLNAVCNMDPGVVVLDIGTNFGSHGDNVAAQVLTEIPLIIERLFAAGHLRVVLGNIRPRDDLSGSGYVRMDAINAGILAYTRDNVVKWTPSAALSTDTHTYTNAGDRYDLIHPTASGAYRAGLGANSNSNSLSYVLRQIYEDDNWFEDDLSAAVNKANNGRLTGSGGTTSSGVSGPCPTGYTISGTAPSAVSCVASLEANAVTGGQNIVMTFTSTGAGASTAAGLNYEEFLTSVTTTLASSGFVPTDFVQMWMNVEVDDSASQILGNVHAYCRSVGGWITRAMGMFAQTNIFYPGVHYGPGWMQTDPKPVGASTQFQQRLYVYVRGDVAGTAVVKLLGVSLQKVGDPQLDFPYDGVNHLLPGSPITGLRSGVIASLVQSIARSIPRGLF